MTKRAAAVSMNGFEMPTTSPSRFDLKTFRKIVQFLSKMGQRSESEVVQFLDEWADNLALYTGLDRQLVRSVIWHMFTVLPETLAPTFFHDLERKEEHKKELNDEKFEQWLMLQIELSYDEQHMNTQLLRIAKVNYLFFADTDKHIMQEVSNVVKVGELSSIQNAYFIGKLCEQFKQQYKSLQPVEQRTLWEDKSDNIKFSTAISYMSISKVIDNYPMLLLTCSGIKELRLFTRKFLDRHESNPNQLLPLTRDPRRMIDCARALSIKRRRST